MILGSERIMYLSVPSWTDGEKVLLGFVVEARMIVKLVLQGKPCRDPYRNSYLCSQQLAFASATTYQKDVQTKYMEGKLFVDIV